MSEEEMLNQKINSYKEILDDISKSLKKKENFIFTPAKDIDRIKQVVSAQRQLFEDFKNFVEIKEKGYPPFYNSQIKDLISFLKNEEFCYSNEYDAISELEATESRFLKNNTFFKEETKDLSEKIAELQGKSEEIQKYIMSSNPNKIQNSC